MQRLLSRRKKKREIWRLDKVVRNTYRDYGFESLDDIILELQSGELSLEDSFKKYEDGMKLIKKCNETIDKVEKKLTVVETDDE